MFGTNLTFMKWIDNVSKPKRKKEKNSPERDIHSVKYRIQPIMWIRLSPLNRQPSNG